MSSSFTLRSYSSVKCTGTLWDCGGSGEADLFACWLDSTCIDGDDASGVSPDGGTDDGMGGEHAGDSCLIEVATSNFPTESPLRIVMGHSHGLKIRTGTCSFRGFTSTRSP